MIGDTDTTVVCKLVIPGDKGCSLINQSESLFVAARIPHQYKSMSELKSCTPTDIDSEKVIIQIENDAEKAFHSSDERVAHLAPFALAVILYLVLFFSFANRNVSNNSLPH